MENNQNQIDSEKYWGFPKNQKNPWCSVIMSCGLDSNVFDPCQPTPHRVSVQRVLFLVCLERLTERCSSWPTKSWRETTTNTRKCLQKLSWWVLRPHTWWRASHWAPQGHTIRRKWLVTFTWSHTDLIWGRTSPFFSLWSAAILFYGLPTSHSSFIYLGLAKLSDDCLERGFVLETCTVRQGYSEFLQMFWDFWETPIVAIAAQCCVTQWSTTFYGPQTSLMSDNIFKGRAFLFASSFPLTFESMVYFHHLLNVWYSSIQPCLTFRCE